MEKFTVTDCNFPAIHLLQGMCFWILFKEKDFPSKSFRTVQIGKKYSKLLLFLPPLFFFLSNKNYRTLLLSFQSPHKNSVCVKSYLSKNKTQRKYLSSLFFFFPKQ